MDIAGQNKKIAEEWFRAFNKKDLEALLSLYHDKASHFSPKLRQRQPETKGLISGKPALRSWWQDAFERLPSLHYQVSHLTADDTQVVMEYTRCVTGEEDLEVCEVLKIEHGLIVFSKVYHG